MIIIWHSASFERYNEVDYEYNLFVAHNIWSAKKLIKWPKYLFFGGIVFKIDFWNEKKFRFLWSCFGPLALMEKSAWLIDFGLFGIRIYIEKIRFWKYLANENIFGIFLSRIAFCIKVWYKIMYNSTIFSLTMTGMSLKPNQELDV